MNQYFTLFNNLKSQQLAAWSISGVLSLYFAVDFQFHSVWLIGQTETAQS
jgi:hypothetical protein